MRTLGVVRRLQLFELLRIGESCGLRHAIGFGCGGFPVAFTGHPQHPMEHVHATGERVFPGCEGGQPHLRMGERLQGTIYAELREHDVGGAFPALFPIEVEYDRRPGLDLNERRLVASADDDMRGLHTL